MSMTDQNIIINLWKAAQLLMNLEENLEEYISLFFVILANKVTSLSV